MKRIRLIFFLLILRVVSYYTNRIQITQDVVVKEGDTYSRFFDEMSVRDRLLTKLYLRLNYQNIPVIYPGVYRFDTPLRYDEFLEEIGIPPKPVTVKVTLLEGWSSFDYDALMSEKWLITSGDLRAYITNRQIIDSLRSAYPFLPNNISSLEGFLYPDTYHIDVNKGNSIEQLVNLQLQNFYNKVRWPNSALFSWFSNRLANDWFVFKMSPYSIIKLASIIENEEKNDANKQTIAWVFLNRIDADMQLGADVTLCYGKGITYKLCTPSYIVEHLYENTNPYNTRRVSGLPPTPISNPSIESIAAVLTYTKTPNLYYLHDPKGAIYYGRTLEEHNSNKSRYLP